MLTHIRVMPYRYASQQNGEYDGILGGCGPAHRREANSTTTNVCTC